MEKRYKDVTYGLKYKDFSPILTRKMRLAKDCKGYEDFKAEIKMLREVRTNCGKVSLVANHWMREICNMNKAEIIKLVNNYEKGTYNPYKFELEQEKMEDEEEEEEI